MKIQFIGLPGAGKTTAINQLLTYARKHMPSTDIHILDIRNYQGICRDRQLCFDLITKPGVAIAESACGVRCNSVIIKMNTNAETALLRTNARGEPTTLDHLYQLQEQMVGHHHIVETAEEFVRLVSQLLEGNNEPT